MAGGKFASRHGQVLPRNRSIFPRFAKIFEFRAWLSGKHSAKGGACHNKDTNPKPKTNQGKH
jgi:hypothetical protein